MVNYLIRVEEETNMSNTGTDSVLLIEGAALYGFAGGKCVQFALQVMGIDVCGIMPDIYDVHFFYDKWSSVHYTVEELEKMYACLKANGLHKKFTHVITGYIQKNEMLSKVAEIVKDLKETNPEIIYVCDPVIGDNGENYKTLPVDMDNIYRNILIPMADITTPNQFEVENLSGMTIHSQDDAIKAIQLVHEKGPDVVVMSSCTFEKKRNTLTTIGCRWKDGKRDSFRIDYPRIDAYMVGTGDLFTGCFTGLMRKTDNMKTSLEKAISIMQVVCQRTFREAKEQAGPGKEPSPDMLELRVVQCASFIMNPQVVYTSTELQ